MDFYDIFTGTIGILAIIAFVGGSIQQIRDAFRSTPKRRHSLYRPKPKQEDTTSTSTKS